MSRSVSGTRLAFTLLAGLSLWACAARNAASEGEEVEGAGEADALAGYTPRGTCDGLPRIDVETPPGVCVGLVYSAMKFPRGLTQLPNGDIYVADMGGWADNAGSVWRFRKNTGGAYVANRVLSLIDKPSGIRVNPRDGLVYVGTPSNIFRFDPATVSTATGAGPPRLTIVMAGRPKDGRHPLTHFVFDALNPDLMYVNMGSASDVCEQGGSFASPCFEESLPIPRAAIRKYTLRGATRTADMGVTIARGLRNSMALASHPVSGVLLQAENSRDAIDGKAPQLREQEVDLPHEELNVIREGAHYGFPYCYDNNVPNPEYPTADCTLYRAPTQLLPGHAAPLGMAYYPGAASASRRMFPDAYAGQLVVAYHGYRAHGHRLAMVPVSANGTPGIGEPRDIIRGWEANAATGAPTGSPVDVLVASDGALFITDDKNHALLRVSYSAAGGNGLPLTTLPYTPAPASPEEVARCTTLAAKTSAFARIEREVIDKRCASCHGAGPGYAGNLALLRCDDTGNAARLLGARPSAPALVLPGNMQSELLLRMRGAGYPQMPAGGVDAASLSLVEAWILSGAPLP